MTSSPLSPASGACHGKPQETNNGSPTLTMSPQSPHSYTNPPTSNIYRMPEYMCWLCRREIEAVTIPQDQSLKSIPRPALCRIISFTLDDTKHSQHPVSISGIGYRLPSLTPCGRVAFVVPQSQDQSIEHAPARSSVQTPEVHLKPVSDPVHINTNGNHIWTFRVHADCWDLVESRTTGDINSCAQAWCKTLASLNWNFTTFSSGMGRYELPKILLSPSRPFSNSGSGFRKNRKNLRKLDMERLSNYKALAVELGLSRLPSFDNKIPLSRFNLYTPALTSPLSPTRSDSSTSHDIFSSLPEELLQQIIQHTKTTDLVNLRLASRRVAYVSRLGALPRSFWFSRFLPGFELSFALPDEVDRTLDWRGLYFLIKKALKDCEVLPPELAESPVSRLARRKYWTQRFSEVSKIHDGLNSRTRLAGRPFVWPCADSPRPEGLVSAQLVREDDGAQRYYSTVSVELPASSSLAAIGISTVCLCGQYYISGLRFFYRDGTAPKSLGYVSEQSETIVYLGDGDVFGGFDVRLDNDAIRSLRVINQTGLGEGVYRQSSWIGAEQTAPDLDPRSYQYTSVQRGDCEKPCTLAARFDHVRMIAIGIVDTNATPTPDEKVLPLMVPTISPPVQQNPISPLHTVILPPASVVSSNHNRHQQ